MKKGKLYRLLSCFLIMVIFLQVIPAEALSNVGNNKNPVGKGSRVVPEQRFKEPPEGRSVVNKEKIQIPPGPLKKEDKLEKWLEKKELKQLRSSHSKTFFNLDLT